MELLLLTRRPDGLWEALARPSRRLRPGVVIDLDGLSAAVVAGPATGVVTIDLAAHDVEAAIAAAGVVPLPPYFKGTLDDSSRYQTMFARSTGSAAAPTAGLHFDAAMLRRLDDMGVERACVTLHVGAGTFQPVRTENLDEHRMHAEQVEVGEETCAAIEAARARAGRVIAVGTTVVRSLESAWRDGAVRPFRSDTRLFIRPGYRFRAMDALLTNFHLPESTLLMLVSAFAGTEHVLAAYRHAVRERYRFFSYGDAMFATAQPGAA